MGTPQESDRRLERGAALWTGLGNMGCSGRADARVGAQQEAVGVGVTPGVARAGGGRMGSGSGCPGPQCMDRASCSVAGPSCPMASRGAGGRQVSESGLGLPSV